MERLLWICLGGAAGTAARYGVQLWAVERLGAGFPYGTLIVNMLGCFVMTLTIGAGGRLAWPPTVRAALSIGVLGGFTTYSSFNYETMRLLEQGALGAAGVNILATMTGGLLAGGLGLLVARQLLGG